jgi:chloramphenicol 3-O-phosphotransferase
MKPMLIYLYGPPASGKLTVAEKLAELTGFTLFHNHVTVNAIGSVFPFGSEAYEDVLHRLRLDVFGTASKTGANLIFTNNSAWPGPYGRARFQAFATEAEHAVETHGCRTVFVRLNAPLSILEERLQSESRRAHKKLLDIGQLRELVLTLDESPLHGDDLCIDTSVASADDVARSIFEALK